MARRLAALLALAPGVVFGCEASETLYFACTFSGGAKTVEICHDLTSARYSFGPPNAPELNIEAPVTDVHLTPWPGVGRDIWEEIIFENRGHSYLIAPRIERSYPADETSDITVLVSGVIIVAKDDVILAQLTCDPASANFPWDDALYKAKEAHGQCYDRMERLWHFC